MPLLDLSEPALLDELVEIVTEMLDGIAEASIPEGIQPAKGYEHQMVEAVVEVIGGQRCTLVVRLQASMAIGLAAALLEEDPSDLAAEDACAVLAELSNVLGGSIKSVVEEETALGIPQASIHDTDNLEVLEGSIFVDHPLGAFQVKLGP